MIAHFTVFRLSNISSWREDTLLFSFEMIPDVTDFGKYRDCHATYKNLKIFSQNDENNSWGRKGACHRSQSSAGLSGNLQCNHIFHYSCLYTQSFYE